MIKLSIREIEILRKLATGNEDAKKVLAKFTPIIEITADFE